MDIGKRNRALWESIQKGDISVGDLITDGGYLPPEQDNRFLRKIYQKTRLLGLVRQETMTSPIRKIHKIGITGNFLHGAPASGTALDAAKRSKVFTEYVQLVTSELIGSMYIPYDVIEDNIEKDLLENTLMDEIIPQKAARDLEKVMIQGDLLSGDSLLSKFDGILAILNKGIGPAGAGSITTNVCQFTDITGVPSDNMWEDWLETLGDEYREEEDNLRYLVNRRAIDTYARNRRARLTAEGDQVRVAGQLLDEVWRGVPILSTPRMPMDYGLLSNPQNFILGTQRGTQIETARDIEARMIVIVLTMRVAVGIEESEAVSMAVGVNPSRTSSTTV
jgi:HK97 family phage major capsid protein